MHGVLWLNSILNVSVTQIFILKTTPTGQYTATHIEKIVIKDHFRKGIMSNLFLFQIVENIHCILTAWGEDLECEITEEDCNAEI